MNEFQLIRRFFTASSYPPFVRLGVGDDGALLSPAPGTELVMSMDTLVAGVHFPEDLPPADLGWRSLAVNLSDLAAMGATPRCCLLSLTLPSADEGWLEAFSQGFNELAAESGAALVGGDMTRGPLSISIQVTGEVPAGKALLRSGARPGDRLCVGGVPGEAAAGLAQWQSGVRSGHLPERFVRPVPQLSLGAKLRGLASACIDISDGLLADLTHILEASGVGAQIHLDAIPVSAELASSGLSVPSLQLCGGDDYLLLFTLPPAINLPRGCHRIGRILAEPAGSIRLLDADGKSVPLPAVRGFDHFPN